MKLFKTIYIIMAIFAVCIVLFSSLVNLYEKRKLILKQIIFTSSLNNENIKYDEVQDKDRKWFAQSKYDETIAKDIPNGGYILFVRHAHREKWIDVTMYDAYETLVNVKAENTYFDKAVCLSSRGKVQAKMMGEFIRKVKIPISEVISSPSCRSRQTAELAFGGYDRINKKLLHFYGDPYGPFNQSKKNFFDNLKDELLKIKVMEGSNVIVSAHNNLIIRDIIDNVDSPKEISIENIPFHLGLEEGGFFVLKVENGKLIYVTKFHTFQGFIKNFLYLP